MAYTTNPYCDIQDVKDAMALKSTSNDAWIGELIAQAQAHIDNYTGYPFQTDGSISSPTIRKFNGHETQSLYVGWIQQLISVTQVGTGMGLGDYLWIEQSSGDITADCFIAPDNQLPGWEIQRISFQPFYRGRQNYSISGIWGYGSIPPDITRACIRIAVHWYQMRTTNYADMVSEQGNTRIRYTKQLPDDVVEILENYRLHTFYSHD